MGTRGFLGFVANGHETIAYNQFDSYPDALGIAVLDYARSIEDMDAAKRQAAAIVHVSNDVPPTDEQIEALKQYANMSVGARNDRPDWYQLLRETQGDPAATLAAGHAEHHPDWPADSLFCEWGYLIDFDRGVLQVYEGFQRSPHTAGRFHDRKGENAQGYYPVRLIATWALDALPDDAAFVRATDPGN
ncbi:hypothetical protein ACIBQ0_16920 [Nocardia nova]|uniref:hypothetical protein n=1 Tax=Nocardia nova TaxID=37330 RepID=UPI00378DF1E5